MTLRRLGEVLGVTGLLLLIAGIAAFFSTLEFYSRTAVLRGGTPPEMDVDSVLLYQVTYSTVWAFFAPLVFALAWRFPLRNARNVVLMTASVPVISLVRTVVGSMFLEYTEGKWPTWSLVDISLHVRLHRNMFYAAVIIGVTNLLHLYREERERERRALELEAQLSKEQLEQLRTKLHPQFLFATLRAIKSLVRSDPAAADRMLVALSALLRRNLDLRERTSVTLAEELEFVDRYLGLQGVALRVDLDDRLLAVQVPPMLLQPLVDDALARGGPVAIAGGADGLEVRAHGEVTGCVSITS